MPRSGKPIDEKLNEALERVSAIRREKRREDAKRRREERDRRLEAERHLGAFHFERLEQLAASDPAAAAAEWSEVRDWAERRVRTARGRAAIAHFAGRQDRNGTAGPEDGPAPAPKEKSAAGDSPDGTALIWIEGSEAFIRTPRPVEEFRTRAHGLGGRWNRAAGHWRAPAGNADAIIALARECYGSVNILDSDPGRG